jgi:hypothetical protein
VRKAYTIHVGDHPIGAKTEGRFETGPVTLAFRSEDTLLLDS